MAIHTFDIHHGVGKGIELDITTTTHGRQVKYTTRRNRLTIWPTFQYTCRHYIRKHNISNYTFSSPTINPRRHMVRVRGVSMKCVGPNNQIHTREELGGGMSGKRPASEVLEDESGGISHPNKWFKRPFACPYYKNSPQSYSDCQEWHNYDISHVKDHIKRVHLRPHLCDRSGNISEAGTPNQNLEAVGYMRTNGSNSQDMNSGEEVSGLGLESAETWQEIYMFLFPQRIPNKFWEVQDDVDWWRASPARNIANT